MKYVIFALIFASVGAIFALQNATAVTVSFAVWSFQTSLVLVILGSATVGALITLLLSMPMQIRLRWKADKAVRHAAELEAKLTALDSAQPAAVQGAAVNQAAANGKGINDQAANEANKTAKGMSADGV